jgi:lysophospholipase L1-like esterase
MRRLIPLLAAMAVALAVAGCSSPSNPAEASASDSTTAAPSTTAHPTTTFAPLLEPSTTTAVAPSTTTVAEGVEEDPIEIETDLADGDAVDTYVVQFSGSAGPGSDVEVNGETVIVESNGSFSVPIHSQIGANEVVVVASTESGGETTAEIRYTFEPPDGWIDAIGDSVMLGAIESVESRLGEGIVDAIVSRQFHDLPGLIEERLARENPPQVLVIHLGTNGDVSEAEFEEAMVAAADVPMVVFVNTRVPRDWETSTNAVLAAGVERWDNAVLVDWFTPSDPDDSYFAADGFHPSLTGRVLYADLIVEAIFPTGEVVDS